MPWAFRLTSLVPSLGPGRMTTALYTASQESLIWLTMRGGRSAVAVSRSGTFLSIWPTPRMSRSAASSVEGRLVEEARGVGASEPGPVLVAL